MMEYRTLDLTISSANDLKQVNVFSKMDVYVVVSIFDNTNQHLSIIHKQTTPIDKKGDKNPRWNHPIKFTLNDVAVSQNRISLLFQIFSARSFLGDKLIGEVLIPLSQLLSAAGETKESNFLSYQVQKRSSKPKGVLNFSFKLGEKFSEPPPAAYPPPSATIPTAYPPPLMGQPVHGYPPPPPPNAFSYPYQGPGYGHGYSAQTGGVRRNNFGMGMGAGLLGGALAGMLIGDLVSDAAYDGGYDGGFDGGYDGGFDGGFDF